MILGGIFGGLLSTGGKLLEGWLEERAAAKDRAHELELMKIQGTMQNEAEAKRMDAAISQSVAAGKAQEAEAEAKTDRANYKNFTANLKLSHKWVVSYCALTRPNLTYFLGLIIASGLVGTILYPMHADKIKAYMEAMAIAEAFGFSVTFWFSARGSRKK